MTSENEGRLRNKIQKLEKQLQVIRNICSSGIPDAKKMEFIRLALRNPDRASSELHMFSACELARKTGLKF